MVVALVFLIRSVIVEFPRKSHIKTESWNDFPHPILSRYYILFLKLK